MMNPNSLWMARVVECPLCRREISSATSRRRIQDNASLCYACYFKQWAASQSHETLIAHTISQRAFDAFDESGEEWDGPAYLKYLWAKSILFALAYGAESKLAKEYKDDARVLEYRLLNPDWMEREMEAERQANAKRNWAEYLDRVQRWEDEQARAHADRVARGMAYICEICRENFGLNRQYVHQLGYKSDDYICGKCWRNVRDIPEFRWPYRLEDGVALFADQDDFYAVTPVMHWDSVHMNIEVEYGFPADEIMRVRLYGQDMAICSRARELIRSYRRHLAAMSSVHCIVGTFYMDDDGRAAPTRFLGFVPLGENRTLSRRGHMPLTRHTLDILCLFDPTDEYQGRYVSVTAEIGDVTCLECLDKIRSNSDTRGVYGTFGAKIGPQVTQVAAAGRYVPRTPATEQGGQSDA